MNATLLTTILVAVLGSGALTTLTSWLLHRADRRDDLEKALRDSPTIRRIELELFRQTLFLPTTDRAAHEHQLEAGREYLALGGNGSGHARFEQLEADYKDRLSEDDWDYPS